MSTEKLKGLKVALAIRLSRSLLGMSLREMGDYCNVAASTVGKWESNELPVKVLDFMKLHKLFSENGISFNLDDDKELSLSISTEGLEKQLKFHEARARLKSGVIAEIGKDEIFLVSPEIKRRKKRTGQGDQEA